MTPLFKARLWKEPQDFVITSVIRDLIRYSEKASKITNYAGDYELLTLAL